MKFLKRYHLKNFNFILVTFVTALSIIGIMAVGSAQKSMQGKQIFGVILGLLVMLLFSVIDYKWILRFYWILYAVNLILLLLVHFFGAEANNAVRWLDFGFIRFQPSDPTKILMILFFAQFLTKHRKKVKSSSYDHGSDCFDPSLFVFDLQAAELVYHHLPCSAVLCPLVSGRP